MKNLYNISTIILKIQYQYIYIKYFQYIYIYIFWKYFLWDMWICLVSFYCLYRLVWWFVILSVYFILCGDFNFVPSYSIVETGYMVIGIIGLLIISIFGGGSLMWLICPTHSVICLPYYLKLYIYSVKHVFYSFNVVFDCIHIYLVIVF